MPLVAHNKLPTFSRLQERGHIVLTLERAQHQDIRELHIGLLNIMPDAALTATERQFKGHPEYHSNSLLKEYKREVARYFNGERETVPRYPEHYFSNEAIEIAAHYVEKALQSTARGNALPEFPEKDLESLVDNTWGDTGKAIVNNWLGLVYQFTGPDRSAQFMHGIDSHDPLKLRA